MRQLELDHAIGLFYITDVAFFETPMLLSVSLASRSNEVLQSSSSVVASNEASVKWRRLSLVFYRLESD